MPLKMQMPFRDIARLLFSEYSKGWYVLKVFRIGTSRRDAIPCKTRKTFHENEAARRPPFERAMKNEIWITFRDVFRRDERLFRRLFIPLTSANDLIDIPFFYAILALRRTKHGREGSARSRH
ncbi:hypothetical protein [Candidatus Manganitrophus noduliformans]|uniref:Uncharacterized protein n=1 Tax=Candidatus Manganitrophus noduliformans TaxID=2606439 RepID=A0A7X6DT89_9BACT|nr:hypothetical protein [Candidatus Manganitrophus noduliformans]NKE72950.1 hypothetical protein [Candidatus Manganitrophus noduliformans]